MATPIRGGEVGHGIPERESSLPTAVSIPGGVGDVSTALENAEPLNVGCCDVFFRVIASIPKSIGDFFCHRYADFRICLRAFFSMGSGTTRGEIEIRRSNVLDLLSLAENARSREQRERVAAAFSWFPLATRDLFFYVDRNYLAEFVTATIPEEVAEMREEIVRECERVVSNQNFFENVNWFYRLFRCQLGSALRQLESELTTVAPLHHSWDDGNSASRLSEAEISEIRARVGEIPGAVLYDRDNIPDAVRERSEAIKELIRQYTELGGADIDDFNCRISLEIMDLPVFDLSHPLIQDALQAGRADQINNVSNRHNMSNNSYEDPRFRAPCWCGHHFTRETMAIDTQLQERIFTILTERIAAARGGTPVVEGPVVAGSVPPPAGTETPVLPTRIASLPGVVPYDRNNIPGTVRTRAREIERLVAQVNRLNLDPNPFPDGHAFVCPISSGCMSIPVFDVAIHTGAVRHHVDYTSLEGLLIPRTVEVESNTEDGQLVREELPLAPPSCCICRVSHALDTRRRPVNVVIDEALQMQIWEYLNRLVNQR